MKLRLILFVYLIILSNIAPGIIIFHSNYSVDSSDKIPGFQELKSQDFDTIPEINTI
jgi:hypothetical protein